MVKYLDRIESLEVEIQEWAYFLLAPDQANVDVTHIALHAKGDWHQKIFHTLVRMQHVGMSMKERSSYTS